MIDKRVQTLVCENKNTRLHVLMVLWASPEPLSAKDISEYLDCHADTVQALLPRMLEGRYVSQWPSGRHVKWWVGENAGQLFLPGLSLLAEGEKVTLNPGVRVNAHTLKPVSEGEKVTLSPGVRVTAHTLKPASEGEKVTLSETRSIDLDRSTDQDGLSRLQATAGLVIDSDAARRVAVTAWCNLHSVTGEKRRDVLADPFCTVARLDGWLTHWKGQGCTAKGKKFYNKWGPLNYAIRCCLNHDEPPGMAAVSAAVAAPAADSSPDGRTSAADDADDADEEDEDADDQPVALKQERSDILPMVWSAICDRVIARDPELFTECLAYVRPLALRAGVLRLILPLRLNRLYLANEKDFLALAADVLEDELVRVDLEVWGPP